ncbi:putative Ig domain-containing protein, partial [Planotetraspora mira]
AGLTGVTQISAGGEHSLALRSNGTVMGWGADNGGQLGDGGIGTGTERHTPVAVKGLTGVVQIDAGGGHGLAVRSDGTVWAWGDNTYGQVGDGSYYANVRTTPVAVEGLTNVVQVSGSLDDSVAVRSNGTVAVWGNNSLLHGQRADGTPVTRPGTWPHVGWKSPVYVPGLSSVTQISTGGSQTLVKVGPPTLAGKASITGTGAVGTKLTCKTPFVAATSVSYTWSRDTTPISGATASTYTPVTGDAAHKVTCKATATNNLGSTDTTASISAYIPAKFSTGTPPVAQTGKYFIYQFAATGTPTPKVTLASGTLPSGLKLATGGTLSGTPSKGGSYTFTLQATGGIGTPTKASKTVIVNGPAKFTTATPPTARAGKYYIYKFPTTGYPAPKVTLASGKLPTGLKLATGGTLSGTPTRKGTYKFTLKAANGIGTPATTTKSVTVQ